MRQALTTLDVLNVMRWSTARLYQQIKTHNFPPGREMTPRPRSNEPRMEWPVDEIERWLAEREQTLVAQHQERFRVTRERLQQFVAA